MAQSYMSDLEWEFIKAVLPNKTRGKERLYSPLGYISPATVERNFYHAELTATIAAE